jgi:ubiquinone/menaquinone biosynthesis C-methylase UbiE
VEAWGVLDVGCGDHPSGSLNVDVQKTHSKCAFVQADCHYLPFRNGAFTTVYSNYVLPYVEHPEVAIREMLRVAEQTVQIRVPHKFSVTSHNQYGRTKPFNSFDVPWFKKLLGNYNILVDVEYKHWSLYRWFSVPPNRPAYITVKIWKRRC